MNMQGKVALITGAAGGIGLAIARAYAEAGAKVVLTDVNEVALAEAKASLGGVDVLTAMMDVTDEQSVAAAFEQAVDCFGHVDVVNCNAGVQTIASMLDFDVMAWRRLIDIHITGSFLTAQAGMRLMKQQGSGGRIIVTGSIHSFAASIEKSAYVTAKHGLLGMVRAIAKEGAAYGVAANLVAPGFVRTPLVEKQIPEQAKALGISEQQVVRDVMLGDTVDGEFTTLEEVAATALFFATFPSLALTGQSLLVAHGWQMV